MTQQSSPGSHHCCPKTLYVSCALLAGAVADPVGAGLGEVEAHPVGGVEGGREDPWEGEGCWEGGGPLYPYDLV